MEYIQKIHDLFERPLPSYLRRAYGGSAVVVPIQTLELQPEEPYASEIIPGWSPDEFGGAVPDEDDLVSYLTQADTEAILGAGLPLPDLESTPAQRRSVLV